MPRFVVPIFSPSVSADSRCASSSRWSPRISVTLSAILERLGRHRNALRSELADFLDEMQRIEHDPIANHGELARPHDAGGKQRQLIDVIADDQSMPGIVAALEPHNDIGFKRKPIDDLALALVTPLGADHHHIRHRSNIFQNSVRRPPRQRPAAALRRLPSPVGTRSALASKAPESSRTRLAFAAGSQARHGYAAR